MGVSSGEEFPSKIGIRVFPHNQSGWAKSGLAGHTGDSGDILGTTTTGPIRILRGRLSQGTRRMFHITVRITLSEGGETSSAVLIG